MVRIVPLTARHAEPLAELERICFSEPRSQSQLLAEVENPLGRFFTAEAVADGEVLVAGYAGMENIAGECYVENIAVFPQFRGQGIGRLLIETLVSTALKEQCELITLEVRSSNIPAVMLYESLGFETVGERKNFYKNPTENARIMTRCFSQEERENETKREERE